MWIRLLEPQTVARRECVASDCQRLTDSQAVSAPGGARLPGQETQVRSGQILKQNKW